MQVPKSSYLNQETQQWIKDVLARADSDISNIVAKANGVLFSQVKLPVSTRNYRRSGGGLGQVEPGKADIKIKINRMTRFTSTENQRIKSKSIWEPNKQNKKTGGVLRKICRALSFKYEKRDENKSQYLELAEELETGYQLQSYPKKLGTSQTHQPHQQLIGQPEQGEQQIVGLLQNQKIKSQRL